jgi:hypothetical protein
MRYHTKLGLIAGLAGAADRPCRRALPLVPRDREPRDSILPMVVLVLAVGFWPLPRSSPSTADAAPSQHEPSQVLRHWPVVDPAAGSQRMSTVIPDRGDCSRARILTPGRQAPQYEADGRLVVDGRG